jgi:hypothetical protein
MQEITINIQALMGFEPGIVVSERSETVHPPVTALVLFHLSFVISHFLCVMLEMPLLIVIFFVGIPSCLFFSEIVAAVLEN